MFHPQVAALAPHPSLVQGDSEVSDLGWVELVLGVPAAGEPLLQGDANLVCELPEALTLV